MATLFLLGSSALEAVLEAALEAALEVALEVLLEVHRNGAVASHMDHKAAADCNSAEDRVAEDTVAEDTVAEDRVAEYSRKKVEVDIEAAE